MTTVFVQILGVSIAITHCHILHLTSGSVVVEVTLEGVTNAGPGY